MQKKQDVAEIEPSYFEVQAYWGATKHFGGVRSTKELIELCRIDKNKYVLEVGCGIGKTPCYIAKNYGSKVVAIDISEKMVEISKERAKREGLKDKIKFMVADATNLPFKDATFDAVICESVNAFIEDKKKAVSEYARVVKPGGFVGFSECIWTKPNPPKEMVDYLSKTTGVKEILTSKGWKELLQSAGLRDIVVRTYKMNAIRQLIDEMVWLGFRDFLTAGYRFLLLSIKNPGFRKYMKECSPSLSISMNFFKYLGFGVFVGKK